MDNIDIRKSILSNFKDSDTKEIEESIENSIKDGEEITLPGLGVFFELLWDNSDKSDKDFIINAIKKGL